jgi:hypothetical protein
LPVEDDQERGFTEGKPRHTIHAGCTRKLTKHERELISDNWHTRTIAEYQDKPDDSLRHILKEAQEAAVAMRGMDAQKEGQYLDEVHYALAELRRRGAYVRETRRDFKYRFERWANPLSSKRGENQIGTIRTTPENYFVADVFGDGSIKFDPTMEAMTRDIDQQGVREWWQGMKTRLAIGQPLQLPAPRPLSRRQVLRQALRAGHRSPRLSK